MVPISVRADDQHGALGNKVSAMMAPLPIWCEDPIERLGLMTERMGDLKSSRQAVGASLLTEVDRLRAPDDRRSGCPPAVAAAVLQPRGHQRPRPQFALYLLGRELQDVFPMVPLAENQGVCFGIMSYNGQVNFGITADYDAMPRARLAGRRPGSGDRRPVPGRSRAAVPDGKRRAAGPTQSPGRREGLARLPALARSGRRVVLSDARRGARSPSAAATTPMRSRASTTRASPSESPPFRPRTAPPLEIAEEIEEGRSCSLPSGTVG